MSVDSNRLDLAIEGITLMAYLITPTKASKEYSCYSETCDDPITPGTLYTRQSYRMTFASGKSFYRLNRWHHFCFFMWYCDQRPKTSERRKATRDKVRQKALSRRAYLMSKVMRPNITHEDAVAAAKELAILSNKLGVDTSHAHNTRYNREALRARLRFLLRGVVFEEEEEPLTTPEPGVTEGSPESPGVEENQPSISG